MEKKINIKKWLLYTYIMLATLLTGTSCVTDNDDLPNCSPTPEPSTEAPAVTAGLYCNDKLIAWEDGKSIGVYMINNETETLMNDSSGAPYIINNVSKGFFLPQWGIGDQVIQRPALGEVRDALGIYPYGTSLKNTKSISLSVADQTDQNKLDVFIPRRVHGITAATDTIHLDFYRCMSRLLFNLKLTEIKADKTEAEANAKLAGATILINGLPVDGTFALESDKLVTGEAKSFQAYTVENGQQGQAIVFPRASTKDVRFQVSIPQCPDTLYSFVLDKDMFFESCRSYQFDFDMKYVQHPVIKQYNVKYRYEGKANKDNVTVTRGTDPVAWGEGDIIRVDENSDFTFRYTSDLKVSVHTEEGETLNMASGQPHIFTKIQKDITVIIRIDEDKPEPEPEVKHKITYRYEDEANANNVKVFKNGMTDAWPLNQTLEVKDKASYTFGYKSDMIVTVKTKGGGTLSMASGKPYTFTNITSDIEIIISAVTPEYAVKYEFKDQLTRENVTVQKEKGSTAFEAWTDESDKGIVYVVEGNDFSFTTKSNYKVTVEVNGAKLEAKSQNSDGTWTYTIENIYENKLIKISTNIHQVTYIYMDEESRTSVDVYKDNILSKKWTENTEVILVDDGKDFTFGTDSEHEVVATANTTSLSANAVTGSKTKNTFGITNIKTDYIVTISAKTEENLLRHNVQYKFIPQANKNNTDIKLSNDTPWDDSSITPSENAIQVVEDEKDFVFKASSKFTLTVTAALKNSPDTNVHVEKNGDTYTIKNVRKNVIISIEATIWDVNFSYSGNYVNATRVPIHKTEDGSSATWNTNYTVKVDNDKNFTFTNESPYTVTVTGYGNLFTVASGQPHTISNIKENIDLVINASIYQVKYVFDTTDSKDVVDVKIENTAWTAEDAGVQYIEKGKSFTFNSAVKAGTNGRIVYVKESGTDIVPSGSTYTLLNIQANKEVHIKAVKMYNVYYQFDSGTSKPAGFNIEGHGNTSSTSWEAGDTKIIKVDKGADFYFKMNQDLEVSATGATFTPGTGADKYTYTTTNVQQDIVITLKAAKPHVTLIMPNEVGCDKSSDFVTNGSIFEFTPTYPKDKPKERYEIKVAYKKDKDTEVYQDLTDDDNDGKFKLPNDVTEDMIIEIKLLRRSADITIEAQVHDWTELKTVDGGSIFPTK